MSETKFTKGEWVISNDGTDSIVNNDLDLHICSLYSRCDNFTHDANLIAVAPKMYKMLESISELLPLLDQQTHPQIEIDALKSNVDNLLKEARGE